MLSGATKEQRDRLGELLRQRRVALDPMRYRTRQTFSTDAGIADRIISDLEHARRPNFSRDTITGFEHAYQLTPGSLLRSAETGVLEPLPGTPGGPPLDEQETREEPEPPVVTDSRATAVITAAVDGSPLEEQVRALVAAHPAGTRGSEIFARRADAAIWDDRQQDEDVRVRMIAALWALRQDPDEPAQSPRRAGLLVSLVTKA